MRVCISVLLWHTFHAEENNLAMGTKNKKKKTKMLFNITESA